MTIDTFALWRENENDGLVVWNCPRISYVVMIWEFPREMQGCISGEYTTVIQPRWDWCRNMSVCGRKGGDELSVITIAVVWKRCVSYKIRRGTNGESAWIRWESSPWHLEEQSFPMESNAGTWRLQRLHSWVFWSNVSKAAERSRRVRIDDLDWFFVRHNTEHTALLCHTIWLRNHCSAVLLHSCIPVQNYWNTSKFNSSA